MRRWIPGTCETFQDNTGKSIKTTLWKAKNLLNSNSDITFTALSIRNLWKWTVIPKSEDKLEKYYLRSKMIVPFLEFDIFWEKFVNTLAAQIALLQENDPFTKKNDQKI